jgi:nitroreductase
MVEFTVEEADLVNGGKDMELEKVLALRQTTRKYTNQKISDEALEKIVKAAQRAPLAAGDAKNTNLTIVNNPELVEEIRQACMLFSKKTGKQVDPFYGAQTIIFVSAKDISDDHIEYCNVGCVIENMILQATALGLGSTYIWGCLRKLRKNEEVVKKLELPQGHQILSALVVGYSQNPIQERDYVAKMEVKIL